LLSACQLPRVGQADLPDDGPPIATSQTAARQFVEKVTDAGLNGSKTGKFALTVTEEEVTSFVQIGAQLAEQLQEAKNLETLEDLAQIQDLEGLEGIEELEQWQELARRREGLPKIRLPDLSLRLGIQDPEVRFQANGQIVVRGYGQVRRMRQPLRAVVTPRASDGELVLDFVEGNLGPVPLPEGLFDLIGEGLAHVILLGQDYAEITLIDVLEGVLTISGRYSTEQSAT
jgi:hypothetical protein